MSAAMRPPSQSQLPKGTGISHACSMSNTELRSFPKAAALVSLHLHTNIQQIMEINDPLSLFMKWKLLSCVRLFVTLYSPWNSPGRNTGVGSLSLLQGIFPTPGSNPGIKPRSPALRAKSLSAEPQGKPKNTGVGSLSLLQQILLTQESNQGLLHCRWILYQLNYQESP